VLMAVFLFSFQIYADFFGYSTIALGCARLLGINIMDNFKTPYLAKSVTEFWSRWHISLSTWFRDYLYIPLGGNRVKLLRWTLNVLIVFTISGLWHGANWTFVVWGILHGMVLLLERYFSVLFKFKIQEEWNVVNIFLVLKTFVVTSFIWIFFRAESFDKVKQIIKAIVRNNQLAFSDLTMLMPLLAVLGIILFDFFLYNSRFDVKLNCYQTPYRWLLYSALLFCLMALSGTQKFTFIYFQF
jgi:alginate O-acetyltransferase complex protein AlgI